MPDQKPELAVQRINFDASGSLAAMIEREPGVEPGGERVQLSRFKAQRSGGRFEAVELWR